MSNFLIKDQGPRSVVADNLYEVHFGAVSFLLGALAGGLLAAHAGRRAAPGAGAEAPEGWSVNIAHRGGAGLAPENTIEGFQRGLSAGAGVIELDVHTSADGHVVVIHDDTVDRTTDGTGPVREMTLAELRRLDAGYMFTPDGGATYPYRERGVMVPTLAEAYRAFPDVPVNIEIKGQRPGIEAAVWRIVEAAGAEDRTLVVADDTPTIRRFRQASAARVATAASGAELISFWLLRLGLGGGSLPYQALQGPETYAGLRVVTPDLVRAAHERGLRVDVWTVDREPDMRRLLGYGVDGIMTDRPDVLARVVGVTNEGDATPQGSPVAAPDGNGSRM